MLINFNFQGSGHNANVEKQGNEELEVILLDEYLAR